MEISSAVADQPSGIYSFDPKKKNEKTTPVSLIALGGHKPVWSPQYQRFAYNARGFLWIADKEGKAKQLTSSLPTSMQGDLEPSIRWNWQGQSYTISHSPEWGSKVHLGGVSDKTPVERIIYEELWNTVFGQEIVPLKKEVPRGSIPTWVDFLNTNNATFSPDGRSIAMETYPAAPYDLRRNQSRIEILDYLPWAGNQPPQKFSEQKSTEDIEKNAGWFAAGASIPPFVGPPRRLTSIKDNSAELNPLWSPTNQWIAFTLVDFQKGTVLPMVIEPSGKSLTALLPLDSSNSAPNNFVKVWGSPHVRVIQWSRDGTFLWLLGGQQEDLKIARENNGKWTLETVTSEKSSRFGLKVFAIRDSQVAWVADRGGNYDVLETANLTTHERHSTNLPVGMQVKWMSW